MRVYLAGPINGCNDDEATTWRDWFKYSRYQLPPMSLPNGGKFPQTLSADYVDPMTRDYRGKEQQDYREIVELDKRDIKSCDVVVVMYSKPSVGTSMEVFYAWSIGIPVIVIDESNQPISPWLRYHSTAIVETKQECCEKLAQWFR